MTGPLWITSYVLLWVAVAVLGLAVVVLLRQIGVLHARLQPTGVHHAGEGPPRDVPAPAAGWFDFDAAAVTLVVFATPDCPVCAALTPSLRHLARREPDVAVEVVTHRRDTAAMFTAWAVRSTPYVVAVDADGIVRGGGVANSLEQVEALVDGVRDREPHPRAVAP